MKRFIFFIINQFLIIPLLLSCSKEEIIIDTIINPDTNINSDTTINTDTTIQTNNITNSEIPLADPFILLYNNSYYAYGTGPANSGFYVYKSNDLRLWEKLGYALKKENVNDNNFWAPEVYYFQNKFFMLYVKNYSIYTAVSNYPEGPFVEISKVNTSQDKCIDPTLYFDNNGRIYLFYSRQGIIYRAEMNNNLYTLANTPEPILKQSQTWESYKVIEGPFIIKKDSTYYLTYSSNGYTSHNYGVGVATSNAITGNWEKANYNPIIQKNDTLVGMGHNSFFYDKKGKLRIAFHAHASIEDVQPRKLCIGNVQFEKQDGLPDKMLIDGIFLPKYYVKQ